MFIAPYDDPYTIAGQGTIGNEILRWVGGWAGGGGSVWCVHRATSQAEVPRHPGALSQATAGDRVTATHGGTPAHAPAPAPARQPGAALPPTTSPRCRQTDMDKLDAIFVAIGEASPHHHRSGGGGNRGRAARRARAEEAEGWAGAAGAGPTHTTPAHPPTLPPIHTHCTTQHTFESVEPTSARPPPPPQTHTRHPQAVAAWWRASRRTSRRSSLPSRSSASSRRVRAGPVCVCVAV